MRSFVGVLVAGTAAFCVSAALSNPLVQAMPENEPLVVQLGHARALYVLGCKGFHADSKPSANEWCMKFKPVHDRLKERPVFGITGFCGCVIPVDLHQADACILRELEGLTLPTPLVSELDSDASMDKLDPATSPQN